MKSGIYAVFDTRMRLAVARSSLIFFCLARKTKSAMSSHSIDELLSWRHHLQRSVTENMLIWQNSWSEPHCGDVCCFSKDCGSIRCDHCGHSLTNCRPPSTRFMCMECPKPEDATQEAFLTLCESCFTGDSDETRFLHPHSKFCRVGGNGAHSIVTRAEGIAEELLIELEDIEAIASPEELIAPALAGKQCLICVDDFENSGDAARMIGCRSAHSVARSDPEEGLVESHEYYHRECYLMALKANPKIRGVYCGQTMPVLCELCNFETEVAYWKKDFRHSFEMLRELFAQREIEGSVSQHALEEILDRIKVRIQLKTDLLNGWVRPPEVKISLPMAEEILASLLKCLHKQPWLRALIDEMAKQRD